MAGYIGKGQAVVSNGAERKWSYTATAAQTTFNADYTNGKVHVYRNGVRLVDGTDYTATDGSTVVLGTGATLGDSIVIVSFPSFSVTDTVSAANGGTFSGALVLSGGVTGDVDATGNFTGVDATLSGDLTAVDATLSGGVYLGGTGSANYLDDYEEGTFTVTTVTGSVSGTEYGTYTKVGNIVHAQIYVAGISDISTAANLEFNLPFASTSTAQDSYVGSLMIRYVNTPTSEIQSFASFISAGSSTVRCFWMTDATSYSSIQHNNFASTLCGCRIGITYRTSL